MQLVHMQLFKKSFCPCPSYSLSPPIFSLQSSLIRSGSSPVFYSKSFNRHLVQMLYLLQVSTRGRYTPQFDAAALETHQRRASPLPGAHVVADIRGAAPGETRLLAVVCVETSKAQGGKKNFPQKHSSQFSVHTALDYAPGRRGDLSAITQLVFVNSALQHWAQFPDISPTVLRRFCFASFGIFFPPVLPLVYLPELKLFD